MTKKTAETQQKQFKGIGSSFGILSEIVIILYYLK
jgi:hypothetical protein